MEFWSPASEWRTFQSYPIGMDLKQRRAEDKGLNGSSTAVDRERRERKRKTVVQYNEPTLTSYPPIFNP